MRTHEAKTTEMSVCTGVKGSRLRSTDGLNKDQQGGHTASPVAPTLSYLSVFLGGRRNDVMGGRNSYQLRGWEQCKVLGACC